MPRRRHRLLRSSISRAWVATSSALVGSSATSNAGSAQSARAMTARWRIPPGELMGIGVDAPLGRGEAHLAEKADGALASCREGDVQMGADRLDELVADGADGVEARLRILEHAPDLLAADAPRRLSRQAIDPSAAEADGAARDACAGRQEADQGRGQERLPGAGLAHKAHDLARCDRERDPVDGPEAASPRRHLDGEPLDLERGRGRGHGLSGHADRQHP